MSVVAPPKLTGGGGFVFENHVAAYFLSCLLADQPPLDPALGTIVRGLQSRLGLHSPLHEMLRAVADATAVVVIDGLDRVFDKVAFHHLSVFVRSLRLEDQTSPWHILVTCQPEEWARVQLSLARANASFPAWQVLDVRAPNPETLEPVWDAFPALRRLALQRHLHAVLLQPKVLDLLATRLKITSSLDTSRWVGESDLIEWFWESEVRKMPRATARSLLLLRLGGRQADELLLELPIAAFADLDPGALDDLQAERICRVHEERVSFSHDIYGDWARQRVLLANTDTLSAYVGSRLASPAWSRAVRLYGLHLLEQHIDLAPWRAAFASLSLEADTDLARDLLLESVIFAADPLPILERMWPDLSTNDGQLLRRLLGRFLYVATLPNPSWLAIVGTLGPDFEVEAATLDRLPYWPYWLPVIRFLDGHDADALRLAPEEVAKIADTWLRRGGRQIPLRLEIAELALTLAEQIQRAAREDRYHYRRSGVDKVVYRAALAAAPDLPNRVSALALAACARTMAVIPSLEDDGGTASPPRQTGGSNWQEDYTPAPWPNGPRSYVDQVFREICLNTDALYPLIAFQPSVAREVLLALLIEPPRPRPPDFSSPPRSEDLAIEHVGGWYPPFYTCGPWLYFLRVQPLSGLEAILRLVNFATERWIDERREGHRSPTQVIVGSPASERRWTGDSGVYFWYQGNAHCPHPIAVALMALEKWLYDELEEHRSTEQAIDMIMRESTSVAFGGVLSAVGRKEPSLLQGPLRPLLTVAEFHLWEKLQTAMPFNFTMAGWAFRDERTITRAREWHGLPHRKVGLDQWAIQLFLNAPGLRSFFKSVRDKWVVQLRPEQEGEALDETLERLVAWFDIGNWVVQQDTDNQTYWAFNAPENLLARDELAASEANERLRLMTFPMQCKQLIEAARSLTSEEVEQLWAFLAYLVQRSPATDAEFGLGNRHDAICAGAAVLLLRHRDWLRRHPGREVWCQQQLLATVRNPPPPVRYDSPENSTDWSWDSFCARAVPILWAEEPESTDLREAMGLLALNHHYQVVSTLFSAAARHRHRLGKHFRQLQHLVLGWAARRRKGDAEEWVADAVQAFVSGAIPVDLPTWFVLVKDTGNPNAWYGGRNRVLPRRTQGLNFKLVQAAYTWVPPLNEAVNSIERAEWIQLWREVLDVTLWMLSAPIEADTSGKEYAGTPSDWDHWTFERVVPVVMQLHPDERPDTFWKPILALGAPGHHWVESYLREWFLNGLRLEADWQAFAREWRAMVEYAFAAEEWSFEQPQHSHRLGDIWNHLMGLDYVIRDFWDEARRPIVQQLSDVYEQWAGIGLKRRDCAARFATFLKQPAAEAVRLPGLVWLAEADHRARKEYFWSGHDMQGIVASLLDFCWRSHKVELRRDQQAFDAFKWLLKRLVEFQHPVALELQQRIAPI